MSLNENQLDCKAIIFDLDGTLLDTLDDIADAANRALVGAGFPPHQQQAYRGFVGDGSRLLITRALPSDHRTSDTIEACLKRFVTEYRRIWMQATRPYTGIVAVLKELTRRHMRMAVVTNKPHHFTVDMMAHYFKSFPFAPILGQREGIPRKPHPRQAIAAAEAMAVQPSGCIFVGDSDVDMQTAHRAGMIPVGAAWGFRSADELRSAGAAYVIAHPRELIGLLK